MPGALHYLRRVRAAVHPLQGGARMSADPTAELTQKTSQAKAEAEFAKAELERVKAEKALADARKPADTALEASKAEKERLDNQKAVADARKALADSTKSADQASAQALIGAVPASGIAGDLTLKPEAGKGEATLLAACAMRQVAATIAEVVTAKAPQRRILIRQGTEHFVNYRQFVFQQALIERVFAAAHDEAARLRADADRAVGQAGSSDVAAVSVAPPILTTAAVALDAVAKLGSYFLSNVEVGPIALSPDAEQLIAAVANALLAKDVVVVLPSRCIPPTQGLQSTLKIVADLVAKAGAAADRLAASARTTAEAGAGPDEARNDILKAAAKTYEQAAATLRNAIAKAEEFIASLGAADAKGIVLLSKILQEKAQYDLLLDPKTLLLSVDVRAGVASYYTRKSLWTFLSSAIPFFVMGGTVVTYDLADTTGTIIAAGLVPAHSGFVSVDRVGSYV
ncbi:hypothetical protein [Bradyrhizobium sp. SZCCHNR1002]|uniref:hypothetical protein n=2 Tax=unclassified Bradyrhizobium TaxID=2631580 RepID=UPI0028EEF3D7|nr:hypothetical protein [Bradyrhizobium sp. SZCCHNR1002]